MTTIGILAEDSTDIETLQVILRKIVPKSVGIKGRSPARGGCAALRRRATAFMEELCASGCSAIVFVHDLDLNTQNNELNSEHDLRDRLSDIKSPPGVERLICIPVEEIEAWFWSDQKVLDRIGKGCAKASSSPHNIKRPKEMLMRVSSRAHGKKSIYSTNMNPELANILDFRICASRCQSFAELLGFTQRLFPI